ncbi:MAG TPA: phage holin family protein [Pseudomonas sp.]
MSEGTQNASSANASPGGSPLRGIGAAALGLLHSHLELLGIELQEQKAASLRQLLYAGLVLLFGLLLLFALSVLVLLLFWDSYRLEAIIGLCLFHGLGCLFALWRLLAALRRQSSPFSASLEELARDREQLLP